MPPIPASEKTATHSGEVNVSPGFNDHDSWLGFRPIVVRVRPWEPFSTSTAKEPVYTKAKPKASPRDSVVDESTSATNGL